MKYYLVTYVSVNKRTGGDVHGNISIPETEYPTISTINDLKRKIRKNNDKDLDTIIILNIIPLKEENENSIS